MIKTANPLAAAAAKAATPLVAAAAKAATPWLARMAAKAAPVLSNLAGKTINAGTAKLVGSAVGATTGGLAGASAAPEGSKMKGALIGAGVGGTVGYMGGKTYAGFGKGGVDSARISGLADQLKTVSETATSNKSVLKSIGTHIGQNWADPGHLQTISQTTLNDAPKNRAMLGFSKNAPIAKVPEEAGSGFTRGLGNMSRNILGITSGSFGAQGSNMLSRTGNVLKSELNETRYYTKLDKATDTTYKYKRSLAGQALGVGLSSGVGMGVMDGMSATNSDGTPASTSKKLYKGTTSALSWGLATPVMGAKAIAYDIPKMFINPEG